MTKRTPSFWQVAALFLCLTLPCLSFNPTWLYTLRGFAGLPHESMTKGGVTDRVKAYFGVTEFTPSMDRAREQIMRGSVMVDDHLEKEFHEAENPDAHCDDEHIQECHTRLKNAASEIPTLLREGDISRARILLGRVLHTLQDFYSHSNWIELGFKGISDRLGRKWPLERLVNKDIDTCQNCSYPGFLPETVKAELDFDDWLRVYALNPGFGFGDNDPMSGTTKAVIATGMIIKRLGVNFLGGLVQIFGGPGFPQLVAQQMRIFGSATLNVLPDCSASLQPRFTTDFLTTGYFGVERTTHSRPAGPRARKCSHGGMFDRDARGIEGISKDTSWAQMSPRHDLHLRAAELASRATIQYLDDVTMAICGTTLPNDCALLKALYGIGPTLSFVIDTTASMAGVIAAVRDAAIRIVNDVRDADGPRRPSAYVLAPFNDPVVPPATTYTDPDRFIEAILALQATGGGDCPELAMQGLSNAVDATPDGGKIFLWTDAGAKDAGVARIVADAAKAKGHVVTVFQFNSGCQTADGFDTVTAKTGGTFRESIPYAGAGATTDMAKEQILQDSIGIKNLIIRFLNPGVTLGRRATATINVPIDTTISFVGFSVNSSTIEMSISRPDGSAIQSTDLGVTEIDLRSGLTTTVDRPAAGVWTVTLTGTENVAFTVYGSTSLIFGKFHFVESRGSHHEGLYPMLKDPTAGDVVVGYAAMEGNFTTAAFELQSLDGTVLSRLPMVPGEGTEEGMPSNLFFGNVSIPTQGFNIYATGKDANGVEYLRFLPGLVDIASPNATLPCNSTMSSNQTSSAAPYPYKNGTSSVAMDLGYATLCPGCQPEPCSTAITSLTRTVVYQTQMTLTNEHGTSTSICPVTTYLEVPCYSSCPTALPVISPGCPRETPVGVKYGSSLVRSCSTCGNTGRSVEAMPTSATAPAVTTPGITAGAASHACGRACALVLLGIGILAMYI